MRVLSWVMIAVGLLLGVLSFVLTARSPNVNVWPMLGAGFVLTLIGLVLLMTEGRRGGRD